MTPDPREALRAAIARLKAVGVESPAVDARRLLEHAANVPAGMLTVYMPDRIPPEALPLFETLVAGRAARKPVAQLIGKREFRGRNFIVTEDTLDPRPDTEALVDWALQAPFTRVLDLGTGTGCILLSLLADMPKATGIGADFSAKALTVAKANAQALDLGARATFAHSDWFSAITGRFDLIVSNPPYIAADEMADLAPEVRDHEPRMALTDEADGLTVYRILAAQAGAFLTPGGRIAVEIGWQQGPAVAALFNEARLDAVAIHPDLDGRDRVVVARWPENLA